MNQLLSYYINSLASKSLSLKKKGVLVDKPWIVIGTNNEIEKLIFKRNNELVISKQGKVRMATWEYFPEAKALLIDRIEDKILLQEKFVDENLVILNIDSTDDFFLLANENEVNALNIPAYLNSLKTQKLKIKEIPLFHGGFIQIQDGQSANYDCDFVGKMAEIRSNDYTPLPVAENNYLSSDRKYTIIIENNRVTSFEENYLIDSIDNQTFEIIGGDPNLILENLNKKITLKGKPVPDSRISTNRHVYEIINSRINEIFFLKVYELKSGGKIEIVQKDASRIIKGDIINRATKEYPFIDGSYKLKGRWRPINVQDNVII